MPANMIPTTPRPVESHVNTMAPVITVAEASTMAIWKAADEISYWWYLAIAVLRFSSAALARAISSLRPSPVSGSDSQRATVFAQASVRFAMESAAASSALRAWLMSAISPAVRTTVWRTVLAWKNDHKFDASTL